MKKFFHYLLLSVAMVVTFTACSDDDDPYFQLPETLQGKAVTIISNGNNLSDAQCIYSLGADHKTVTLNIFGTAAGKAEAASDVPAIAPGYILPGCADVTLTFVPEITATGASYEGQGTSTYCTYTYRVTFTEAAVTVEFKDIVMNSGLILSEITYTDSDVDHMLELTYNGAPMMGKIVKYAPAENEYDKAVITLSGATLDLTDMLETVSASLPLDLSKLKTIPTPGVFPGSVSTDLTITIGSDGSFSGQGETDFLTFEYSGTATASKMALNITEATLKNTAIAGTWNPVPFAIEDDWDSPNYGMPISNPIKFEWISDAPIDMGSGTQIPTMLVGHLLSILPIIPSEDTQLTIPQMLNKALKSVTFQPDGNIVAEYVPKALSTNPAVTSPVNLAQYVVKSDGEVLVFLNPQAIIMAVMSEGSKSRADGNLDLGQFQSIIDALAPTLLNMVQNGAPLQYTHAGDDLSVFLGTEVLKPLLQAIIPVCQNQEVLEALKAMVDQNMAGMGDLVKNAMASLPAVINGTTKLEAGINFQKAAQ